MRTRDREELSPGVARELAALDAALAGEPVAEEHAELRELTLALRAERPVLGAELARRLDRTVEEGFSAPPQLRRRLLSRRLVPAYLGGAASIFIAVTAIVSTLMLNPITTAFDALASRMSDSEIGPTPAWIISRSIFLLSI